MKPNKSGSVKIDPKVLLDAKKICFQEEINISEYITESVKKENEKRKKTNVKA